MENHSVLSKVSAYGRFLNSNWEEYILALVSDLNFPAKKMTHLLVEEGVEGLAVHLGLELLLPLRVRHQEHLG